MTPNEDVRICYMRLDRELAEFTPDRDTELTIGVFDGVHRGHRHLVDQVVKEAAGSNRLAGVITLRNHPSSVLDPNFIPSYLTTVEERLRLLGELGIDTCYDLAMADFVPLAISTHYSARQLVDWILQAKLCMYFGEAVEELRRHSIRTVVDLQRLSPDEIEALAPESALTRSALEQARESVRDNSEIERLHHVGRLLGVYTGIRDNDQSPSSDESVDGAA